MKHPASQRGEGLPHSSETAAGERGEVDALWDAQSWKGEMLQRGESCGNLHAGIRQRILPATRAGEIHGLTRCG